MEADKLEIENLKREVEHLNNQYKDKIAKGVKERKNIEKKNIEIKLKMIETEAQLTLFQDTVNQNE